MHSKISKYIFFSCHKISHRPLARGRWGFWESSGALVVYSFQALEILCFLGDIFIRNTLLVGWHLGFYFFSQQRCQLCLYRNAVYHLTFFFPNMLGLCPDHMPLCMSSQNTRQATPLVLTAMLQVVGMCSTILKPNQQSPPTQIKLTFQIWYLVNFLTLLSINSDDFWIKMKKSSHMTFYYSFPLLHLRDAEKHTFLVRLPRKECFSGPPHMPVHWNCTRSCCVLSKCWHIPLHF